MKQALQFWKTPHHEKEMNMNIHIDEAPAVAALLKQEGKLNARLYQLRQPAPQVSAHDTIERAARRLLGDDDAAPPDTENRQHEAHIVERALSELRSRIQAARTKARRELVQTLRLDEKAATMRQGLADAASRLLELMGEAEEFGRELAFAEMSLPETWPGNRRGFDVSLAGYLLSLKDAGAHVKANNLLTLSGQQPEPDRWAHLHQGRQSAPGVHGAYDNNTVLE